MSASLARAHVLDPTGIHEVLLGKVKAELLRPGHSPASVAVEQVAASTEKHNSAVY